MWHLTQKLSYFGRHRVNNLGGIRHLVLINLGIFLY